MKRFYKHFFFCFGRTDQNKTVLKKALGHVFDKVFVGYLLLAKHFVKTAVVRTIIFSYNIYFSKKKSIHGEIIRLILI